MSAVEVLAPGELSLNELAAQANREHALAIAAGVSMVEHAIRAGEALLQVRAGCDSGQWAKWVAANLDIGLNTASGYMRCARYKDVLMSQPKPPESLNLAKQVLNGLPPIFQGRDPASAERQEQARRFRESGLSVSATAELMGVGVATVMYWTDEGYRARQQALNRKTQARKLQERNARLRAEQDAAIKRAVKKAGAATAEAWQMAERMQDVLAQAQRETEDREARRALSEAGVHYRKMRDEIVRALGVS
jgi:transposase